MFKLFENSVLFYILVSLLIIMYIFAVLKARKTSVEIYLTQRNINKKINIWNHHPRRKTYLILRIIFFSGLILYATLGFFGKHLGSLAIIIYYCNLIIIISSLLFLLFIKCPNCGASLFLQEFNTFYKPLPKICIKCGFPANDIDSKKLVPSIRPFFKNIFVIFIVVPILFIIFTFLFLYITGQLH